jgi:hypothetical protein
MDKKRAGGEIRRGGVIYTPSRQAKGPQETRAVPPRTPKMPAPKARRPARRNRSGFALFFITTMFLGALACVLVFAFVFKAFIEGNGSAGAAKADPSPVLSLTPPPDKPAARQPAAVTCLITRVAGVEREIHALDLNGGKRYVISSGGGTDLRDKYGNAIVFAELAPGDIIEAAFPEEGGAALSIRQSPQAREFKDVSGVAVSPEGQTITIGNDVFKYDGELICEYKEAPFSIADLTGIDVSTVRCYKDRALYVGVSKRSGVLIVDEYPDIFDGTLEIGTSQFVSLGERQEIRVTEGRHRIVAQGSNIQPYTDELIVDAGESYKIDLSQVILKSGLISFTVNEPGVTVTLDGVVINPAESRALDYGGHVVKAEKEGFAAFESAFDMNEPRRTVDIVMEKIVELARLSILSDPDGATVYIDGVYAGNAPVAISVEYGSHTVTVKKDGYVSIDIPIDVNIDNLSRLIILQPVY